MYSSAPCIVSLSSNCCGCFFQNLFWNLVSLLIVFLGCLVSAGCLIACPYDMPSLAGSSGLSKYMGSRSLRQHYWLVGQLSHWGVFPDVCMWSLFPGQLSFSRDEAFNIFLGRGGVGVKINPFSQSEETECIGLTALPLFGVQKFSRVPALWYLVPVSPKLLEDWKGLCPYHHPLTRRLRFASVLLICYHPSSHLPVSAKLLNFSFTDASYVFLKTLYCQLVVLGRRRARCTWSSFTVIFWIRSKRLWGLDPFLHSCRLISAYFSNIY